MTKLKSPITWFGGKQRLAHKLIELIPEHKIYTEVFGGGASLLLNKEASPVEIYNDLDSDLVNFFRVLRDPALFAEFYNKAWMTPYSREEWQFCKDNLNVDPSPVERARRFFVLARWSFSGHAGNSFGLTKSSSSNGMVALASSYRNILCLLPLICERLSRTEIENRDWRKIIASYDTEDTFFYMDPPYIPSTRLSGKYSHEMTEDDHKELVSILMKVKDKVLLSGYPNDLYDELGWKTKTWEVCCNAVENTKHRNGPLPKRTECVWMNY